MVTVILLPGLACDAAMYAHQLPALARHHRVQVGDAHARADSLPEMANLLLAETAGPLVLVGCSMGGMLALEATRQAPERVRAIALLGSSARADTPEMIALRTQACEWYAAGRMDEVLQANVMFAFHEQSTRDPVLVQAYLQMIGRAGPQGLIRQNRAVMSRADLRPLLPTVACPVLVACGEADRLTPLDRSEEIAAAVPGARLAVVPGAGHMLTMEQPARVTALLQDWLATLSV